MAYRSQTALIAALFAISAAPLSADVKRGVDAWTQGDFAAAVSEWQLSAQSGDADALFNLAQAYRLGRGVPADIDRARELYAEAAQKGHVKAADNYGLLLFQQGQAERAMPLIRAASERGDPRAQYVMGLAHFNADYAEKDWVKAYALLSLAQGAGLPQATGALEQMDAYIPMKQRQMAQVMAREIEAEGGRRRAAQLAALDLQQRGMAPAALAQPVTPPSPQPAPVPQPAPAKTLAKTLAKAPAAPPAVSATPVARSGGWAVQLGAFGVAGNADRLWNKLSGNPALSGTRKALVGTGKVKRLRAVGYSSRADASRACAELKRQGQDCLVKAPSA
ncbi:MAG: SPOR domain-containing protein [Erythrobacter sp.]|uniref:SPOR domain-containing protein n=1 Tax=Erythrobacter sp. TaxID=1042 RepID=UPI0026317970|nr:SPOR domain-containing protein [Erythrobacter sp.]MDJ0978916.1 SPOR domain-containing protein [Erythrobacter sp.]